MIKIEKISYRQTGYFSKIALDYVENSATLRPFYTYEPTFEAIESLLEAIQRHDYKREVLAEVFHAQYQQAGIMPSAEVLDNIAALRQPNTYSVVTGHQPCLFGGPLYFVYKIAAAVSLAKSLTQKFPHCRFVPIYWIGSEDHDFAEINHIKLFGQTLKWDSGQKGATGRMKTVQMQPILDEMKSILGNGEYARKITDLFEAAYNEHNTLGQATRYWINALFEKYGLLILDQDDILLKRLFLPIMQQEVAQMPTQAIVNRTNQNLEANGYTPQAFVREINLFYLADNLRERIVLDDNQVMVQSDPPIVWANTTQMMEYMAENPDKFSPNVILRPLYQQTVLPSVAYIGGGGELAYWLQLRDLFAHFGVHYPMLCLRNSALNIDSNTALKMPSLHLSKENLFVDTDKLINDYVLRNTANELNLAEEKMMLAAIFDKIRTKAAGIDSTLQGAVAGEMAKTEKAIDVLEAKLLRAEKRNFETDISRIRAIKEKLFPENRQLQERYDSFLPYYIKYGDDFIETLVQLFNPIEEKSFLCLYW